MLPSEVAEVVELPAQHFTNGAVMYGIRVVGANGASKDLYSDDKEALDAWAADLARCTPAARQRRAAKARNSTASAPAPIAATTAAAALMATPSGRQLVAAAALRNAHGELTLSDFCEVDWSRMLGSGLFACVLRGRMHDSGEAVAVKIIKAEAYKEYMEMVKREATVWSAVGHHPHIVHLKQVLESRTRMYFIAGERARKANVQMVSIVPSLCEHVSAGDRQRQHCHTASLLRAAGTARPEPLPGLLAGHTVLQAST